jgi:hypothetical protein
MLCFMISSRVEGITKKLKINIPNYGKVLHCDVNTRESTVRGNVKTKYHKWSKNSRNTTKGILAKMSG